MQRENKKGSLSHIHFVWIIRQLIDQNTFNLSTCSDLHTSPTCNSSLHVSFFPFFNETGAIFHRLPHRQSCLFLLHVSLRPHEKSEPLPSKQCCQESLTRQCWHPTSIRPKEPREGSDPGCRRRSAASSLPPFQLKWFPSHEINRPTHQGGSLRVRVLHNQKSIPES